MSSRESREAKKKRYEQDADTDLVFFEQEPEFVQTDWEDKALRVAVSRLMSFPIKPSRTKGKSAVYTRETTTLPSSVTKSTFKRCCCSNPMPTIKEQAIRVAVYIRIGGSGDCAAFLEQQKAQFDELIRSKFEWESVGFYADVGADSRKQPNLQRLLYDCRAGRIDLVVTKSTSRISRSIPVLMRFVRELAYRKPPVGVYFEDIKMNTLEKDNLMLLFLYECICIAKKAG